MTALQGALVLIKIGNGATPEHFNTIGGMRTSAVAIENAVLDASNLESGNWRLLLSNVGISSVRISGSGIFTDAASEEMLRVNAFANTVANYQFVFANGDQLQGPFLVSSYQRSGDYDTEETYSLALLSAGAISFNAF